MSPKCRGLSETENTSIVLRESFCVQTCFHIPFVLVVVVLFCFFLATSFKLFLAKVTITGAVLFCPNRDFVNSFSSTFPVKVSVKFFQLLLVSRRCARCPFLREPRLTNIWG